MAQTVAGPPDKTISVPDHHHAKPAEDGTNQTVIYDSIEPSTMWIQGYVVEVKQ